MAYSFSLITTVTEIDEFIRIAERDKRTLEAINKSYEVRSANTAEDLVEISGELTTASSALAAVTAHIATMPEGPAKEDEITKKMELEVRVRKLTKSSTKRNAVGQVEREYNIVLQDVQLEKLEIVLTEAKARRAVLVAAA